MHSDIAGAALLARLASPTLKTIRMDLARSSDLGCEVGAGGARGMVWVDLLNPAILSTEVSRAWRVVFAVIPHA